MIIKG